MNKHLKILLLEDSESDAGLIQHEFKKAGLDFTAKVVETKGEFENALKTFGPDIILSDHSLPGFNSLEALKIFKVHNCVCPFILVTGTVSEEFAVRSIKEGADDYILKSNLTRLVPAINHALKTRQMESEKEKAIQQLIASNKELNTFIYRASHDLRGPLASIMGLANVAVIEDKEKLPEYIGLISESAYKLNTILTSLIDVMLIKGTKLIKKQIDFTKLLHEILKTFVSHENFKRINFKIKIDSKKIFFSDEQILNSILFNLIDNSVRYQNSSVDNSFIEITISDFNKGISIEIVDNGLGINADIQDKIFEMFYRGNLQSKGLGLGLYIVKNGVEKLGGSIDVKNDTPKETIFNIYLPGIES